MGDNPNVVRTELSMLVLFVTLHSKRIGCIEHLKTWPRFTGVFVTHLSRT
jgi:hypothetical protein